MCWIFPEPPQGKMVLPVCDALHKRIYWFSALLVVEGQSKRVSLFQVNITAKTKYMKLGRKVEALQRQGGFARSYNLGHWQTLGKYQSFFEPCFFLPIAKVLTQRQASSLYSCIAYEVTVDLFGCNRKQAQLRTRSLSLSRSAIFLFASPLVFLVRRDSLFHSSDSAIRLPVI